jgi:hypothetical protein
MRTTLWSRLKGGALLVFGVLCVLMLLLGIGIFLWFGAYSLLTSIGASDLAGQIFGIIFALCLIAVCLAGIGNFALIPFGDRVIKRGAGVLGGVIAVSFCAFWVTMASFLTYHAVVDTGTAMWQRVFYVVAGWGVTGYVAWALFRPRKTRSPA